MEAVRFTALLTVVLFQNPILVVLGMVLASGYLDLVALLLCGCCVELSRFFSCAPVPLKVS